MLIETSSVTIDPLQWQQCANQDPNVDGSANNHIICYANAIYPKKVNFVGADVYLSQLPISLEIFSTKSFSEKAQKQEGIGKFAFFKEVDGNRDETKSPPAITAWINIEKTIYEDLWIRLVRRINHRMLITLEVLGFDLEYGYFDVKTNWGVNSKPSLTVVSAKFLYDLNAPLSKNDRNQVHNEIELKKRELLKKYALKDMDWKHSQYNTILKEVANNVAIYSNMINESLEAFNNRLSDAIDLIYDIQHHLNEAINGQQIDCRIVHSEDDKADKTRNANVDERCHNLWFHGDIKQAFWEGPDSKYSPKICRDDLYGTVSKYLQRPWMASGYLEWLLIDAMAFDEIREFGEQIKLHYSKSSIGFNWSYLFTKGKFVKMTIQKSLSLLAISTLSLLILFGLPLFIAWIFYIDGQQQTAFFGLITYLMLVLIFKVSQLKDKPNNETQKVLSLYEKMTAVYAQLKTFPLSPKFIRERFLSSANEGAIWPNQIITLLDYAISRSCNLWVNEDRTKYIE